MPGKIAALIILMTFGSATPAVAQRDCAGPISKLRTIVDSDAATGNLNRAVYQQMKPSLAQAADLCRSGRSAEALRELQSVKRRFGYR